MANVGQVTIDLKANAAQFSSEMRKASATVERFNKDSAANLARLGDTFRNVATGAAALVGGIASVTMASAGLRSIIETNKQYQQFGATLETLEGSASKAKAVMASLREYSVQTPFELKDAVEGYARLRSMGIDATERSMKAFGNTAAAMGKNLLQYIDAVVDASTGEFERLKEFGIKVRSENDRLLATFRGNTYELKKGAEDITRFLTAIGETDFSGAMERQMERLPGKLSNLQDAISGVKAAIGEGGLNKAVGEAADRMGAFFKQMESSGAAALIGESLGNAIRSTISAIADFADSFGTPFLNKIQDAAGVVSRLRSEIGYLNAEMNQRRAEINAKVNGSSESNYSSYGINAAKYTWDTLIDSFSTAQTVGESIIRGYLNLPKELSGANPYEKLSYVFKENVKPIYSSYYADRLRGAGFENAAQWMKPSYQDSGQEGVRRIIERQQRAAVSQSDLRAAITDITSRINDSITASDALWNSIVEKIPGPSVFQNEKSRATYVQNILSKKTAAISSPASAVSLGDQFKIVKDGAEDAAGVKKAMAEQAKVEKAFRSSYVTLSDEFLKYQNEISVASKSGAAARIEDLRFETAAGVEQMLRKAREFSQIEGTTAEQQEAIRQQTLRNIAAFTQVQESKVTAILQEAEKRRSEILQESGSRRLDLEQSVSLQRDLINKTGLEKNLALIQSDQGKRLKDESDYVAKLLQQDDITANVRAQLTADSERRRTLIVESASLDRADILRQEADRYRESFDPSFVLQRELSNIKAVDLSPEIDLRAQRAAVRQYEQSQRQLLMDSRDGWAGARVAASEYFDSISNDAQNVHDVVANAFSGIEDVFVQTFSAGKVELKSFAAAFQADMARLLYRKTFGALVESAASSLLGGLNLFGKTAPVVTSSGSASYRVTPTISASPRAAGGSFSANQLLLVGEKGPELARFDRGGEIIPNGRAKEWFDFPDARAEQVISSVTNNDNSRHLTLQQHNYFGGGGQQPIPGGLNYSANQIARKTQRALAGVN